MFFNGANCDIYIGKGAGKKLKDDMYNAKRSVKIISPYLSPYLISELINLKHRGIDVQLITVDKIEDYYGAYEKNMHKLIKQHSYLDQTAKTKRDKWIKISRILLMSAIALLLGTIALFSYLQNFKVLVGIIPTLVILLAYFILREKIKKKRIYNYNYSQLFPFKVFMSPETHPQCDTFIHGKIYLIDDSIAYLGSLNFTASGTKHNYETRIRTVDKEAVDKIKKEFHTLFNDPMMPERCIQRWGQLLYKEPIN